MIYVYVYVLVCYQFSYSNAHLNQHCCHYSIVMHIVSIRKSRVRRVFIPISIIVTVSNSSIKTENKNGLQNCYEFVFREGVSTPHSS